MKTLKEKQTSENWANPSTFTTEVQHNSSLNNQSLTMFSSQQQQKWEDPSCYNMSIQPSFFKFDQPAENCSLLNGNPKNQSKITNQEDCQMNHMLDNNRTQDWDPQTMLNNLSFLEQKIHELQDFIHTTAGERGQVPGNEDELVTQQRQLITADVTSIVIQLISTAGSLLPPVKHCLPTANPLATQLNANLFSSENNGGQVYECASSVKSYKQSNQVDMVRSRATDVNCNNTEEEHESKDEDDGKEEHLLPGSFEILQLEKEEILAPHTHFCTICGKGFKRDANLRMHMRGHGDEYKTSAALAKPNKESSLAQVLLKRYSCPYVGCKRNKDHKKFQPLKTILCVKNHYKRTHCDKRYTCSRCHTKKFSVIADLKTHEKHCGRDKWLCSCGTTFSRKDKLFGHIALFQGHTPAIPLEDNKMSVGPSNGAETSEATTKVTNEGFSCGLGAGNDGFENVTDMKASVEDPYLSLLNYDYSLSGFQDFLQANFNDSLSPFPPLICGEKSAMHMQPGICDMDD